MPTLVMVREGLPETEAAQSRHVVALIPGAQVCLLDGPEGVPFLGDSAATVRAVDEFLSES